MPQPHVVRFALAVMVAAAAQTTAQDSHSSAVTWESAFPSQAFPARILSLGGTPKKAANSQVLCDPQSMFRVRVKSPTPATQVHVEVNVDGFFLDKSSCDVVLENAGQEYLVAPTPRWDFHKLAFNDQPYPATVVVGVKANGADLGQRTLRLQVRAVNDVPFAAKTEDGRLIDESYLFAAFVNENSPVVEVILKEALQWGAVGLFAGYQRSAEDVRMQVFAIWNVLQRHNIKYSSVTTASGFSENVQSQSVRFVSEAFHMSQANCVDGSVLFASVLYKIGIFPVLVKIPRHMFVGYYLNPKSQGTLTDLEFLETTMLGSGRSVVLRDRPFPRHDPLWLRSTISYEEFAAAVRAGNQRFQSEVLPKTKENDPRYRLIFVRKARENGINPIPR
ncbi:MAG TPA: hypothetical protein VEG68_02165 [Terriglobales bacterium]|nr:hypothetical protein [Terriglobales bacterium]